MERYYDGDQEALFKTAHVINPYLKPKRESKVTTENFVYLFTHTNRANDLHTHLDSLSIVRAVVWKITFLVRCSHGHFREKPCFNCREKILTMFRLFVLFRPSVSR